MGDGAISFAGAKEGAGRAGGEAAGAAAPAAEAVQAAQVAEVPQTANGVVSPDQVVASEQTPVTAQVSYYPLVFFLFSTSNLPAFQDTTLLQGMGKQRLPKE